MLRRRVGGVAVGLQHAYGNAININPGSNPQFGGAPTCQRTSAIGLPRMVFRGVVTGRRAGVIRCTSSGTNATVEARRGVTDGVPSSVVMNVPSPIRGDASLGLLRNGAGGGGNRSASTSNGSSHDPEALATLVQRRIDEVDTIGAPMTPRPSTPERGAATTFCRPASSEGLPRGRLERHKPQASA